MKRTHASTLALLLGLGLALPAAAQQQQQGQGGQEQGPVVIQGQHGQTQTSAPEVAGAAGADMDADQYITGEEASTYDEQRWGELTGGGEEMTQEQFTGGMAGDQDAEAAFAEADADQSGALSAEEWMQWRQQRFTEAAGATEGRMGAAEYQTFERGGEAGAMIGGGATGGGMTTGGGGTTGGAATTGGGGTSQ